MPFDIASIRERRPENHIYYFQTIGSTMIAEAARLAASGAAHGTIVLADEQTAGIGRFGRQWHSEAGAGIYCSVIMRLKLPPNGLPSDVLCCSALQQRKRSSEQRIFLAICDGRTTCSSTSAKLPAFSLS